MDDRSTKRNASSAARMAAERAFKQKMAQKPPTDEEIEKAAIEENRHRLKSLRLARESLLQRKNET